MHLPLEANTEGAASLVKATFGVQTARFVFGIEIQIGDESDMTQTDSRRAVAAKQRLTSAWLNTDSVDSSGAAGKLVHVYGLMPDGVPPLLRPQLRLVEN